MGKYPTFFMKDGKITKIIISENEKFLASGL